MSGCATCRHVEKDGNRRGPWRCTFKVVLPPLPDAVTGHIGHEGFSPERDRTKVWNRDGLDCPTQEEA